MSSKNNVQLLVQRTKDLMARSGGEFTPPAWMLDEERIDSTPLTPQEKQEWAECVCKSMRGAEALLYLIDCEQRWGVRNGCRQFVDGSVAIEISRETVELLLQMHVESVLIGENPQLRYLAVFQFYHAANSGREAGEGWMRDLIDDAFRDIAIGLRTNGGRFPPIQIQH